MPSLQPSVCTRCSPCVSVLTHMLLKRLPVNKKKKRLPVTLDQGATLLQHDFILTTTSPWPYFQMRSHSKVLGVITSTCLFRGHSSTHNRPIRNRVIVLCQGITKSLRYQTFLLIWQYFFEESENAQDRPVEWGGGWERWELEGEVGRMGRSEEMGQDLRAKWTCIFSSRTFSGTSWFSGRYSCLRTLRKIVPRKVAACDTYSFTT